METNDNNNTQQVHDTAAVSSHITISDEELNELINESNHSDVTYSDFESDDERQDEDSDAVEEEQEASTETTSGEHDPAMIQPNSPTLLIDDSTTRFSGAEWFSEIQKARVIIAGVGGIGSNVAFQLARMAPACITLYDDDVVERVNMAGQLYSSSDIGKTKVDAIANMVSLYTSARQVYAIASKFTVSTEPGDIMICGFDNMAARKIFYDSWKKHVETKSLGDAAKCLFLDGRLSMDTLQIFCIKGDDEYYMDRYEREFLFPGYQAEQTVCSMKQTTYLACMIGSLMVNLFTNFIANSLNPVIPYDLPFFTEYEAQSMLFKTEC